jgi:hypothetical protein
MVEVWVEELSKWVLIDPTRDATVLVDGQPASVLEVCFALHRGQADDVSLSGKAAAAEFSAALLSYMRAFKHVYVAWTNALFEGVPDVVNRRQENNILAFCGCPLRQV